MDFTKLYEKDWAEFEAKHPEASNFLLARSLKNEHQHLAAQYPPCLNDWQLRRLNELDALYNN